MNTTATAARPGRTVYPILLMVCATHLLNDMMQSVIPAVYPLLKEKFGFTFAQIGLITLVFQLTSSLLRRETDTAVRTGNRPVVAGAGSGRRIGSVSGHENRARTYQCAGKDTPGPAARATDGLQAAVPPGKRYGTFDERQKKRYGKYETVAEKQ